MKDKSSETMAATSRMMRVTSCSASHTNRQKVFGGLGGIVLEPNVSRRCSMSFGEPDNPVISIIHTHTHTRGKKTKKSYLASIAVIYTGRENMNNPIPRPACTQQGDGPDWAHPLDWWDLVATSGYSFCYRFSPPPTRMSLISWSSFRTRWYTVPSRYVYFVTSSAVATPPLLSLSSLCNLFRPHTERQNPPSLSSFPFPPQSQCT